MLVGSLDLAASTGVCAGEAFKTPEFETWSFSGMSSGERCCALLRRMTAWIDRWGFDHVAIEAPLQPHKAGKAGTNAETSMQLNGYVFVALGVCHSRGVPVRLCERQEVLGHFTGAKRYKEKDEGKRRCLKMCEALKWPATNWDEADAAAQWDFAISHLRTKEWIKTVASRGLSR